MDLKLAGDIAVVIGGAQVSGGRLPRLLPTKTHASLSWIATPRSPRSRRRISETGDRTRCRCDRLRPDRRAWPISCSGKRGRVDHVVFAAGVGSGKFGFPFWNLDPSDWDHVLRVNLTGGHARGPCLCPGMAASRRGTLLFLASVAGQIGSQTDPPYSASKAGRDQLRPVRGEGPGPVSASGSTRSARGWSRRR